MQIPSDVKGCKISVERTEKKIEHAVLLSAVDAEISEVELGKNILSFIIGNNVHSAVKCYVPATANVFVNGNAVPFEYSADDNIVYFDYVFNAGDKVEIKTGENL